MLLRRGGLVGPYSLNVNSLFADVKRQRKGFKNTLKHLTEFQKAGLAFVEEGRAVSEAFRELAEAISNETEPEMELPRTGALKLVEFHERVQASLEDMVREIQQQVVEPVQAVIDTSLSSAKAAKKEYDQERSRYDTRRSKYRLSVDALAQVAGVQKRASANLSPLSSATPPLSPTPSEEAEAAAAKATCDKAEADCLEQLKTAKAASGAQCLRLFTSFHGIYRHLFDEGALTMRDMEACHEQFMREFENVQASAAAMPPVTGEDSLKAAFTELAEFHVQHCAQLSTLQGFRARVVAEQAELGISDQEMAPLFGNLEKLLALSKSIRLERLDKPDAELPVMVADAYAPLLHKLEKHHVRYAENSSVTIAAVEAQVRKSGRFAAIVKAVERQLIGAGLGVGLAVNINHLIIIPTRYLPKLRAYIEAVYDLTPTDSPAWDRLYDLVERMPLAVAKVEDARSQSQSMRHLIQVKATISGLDEELVETSHDIRVEGDLKVVRSSSDRLQAGKLHRIVLLSDMVIILAGSDSQQLKAPHGSGGGASGSGAGGNGGGSGGKPVMRCCLKAPVISLSVEEVFGAEPTYGHCFKLEYTTGTVPVSVLFGLRSSSDVITWVAAFKSAIAERKKMQVFGQALSDVMARPQEKDNEIPQFLERTLHYIEKCGLDMQGIFRLSGNAAQVARLQRHIDSGRELKFPDAITAATLLRSWMRSLPDSITSTAAYPQWVAMAEGSCNDEERFVQGARAMVQRLPKSSKFVLARIVDLLRKVVEQSDVNQMNARNISIVMAMSLFPSPKKEDAVFSPALVNLVELFISRYEDVFKDTLCKLARFRKRAQDRKARRELERIAARESVKQSRGAAAAAATPSPSPPGAALSAVPRSSSKSDLRGKPKRNSEEMLVCQVCGGPASMTLGKKICKKCFGEV
eukprot:m51a1_g9699 putative domain-containing protein (920) ;mRNA; f:1376354-1380272